MIGKDKGMKLIGMMDAFCVFAVCNHIYIYASKSIASTTNKLIPD